MCKWGRKSHSPCGTLHQAGLEIWVPGLGSSDGRKKDDQTREDIVLQC